MTWPEGVLGRRLAGTYLAGWLSWLIGVVCVLSVQLAGVAEPLVMVIGTVLFFAGAIGVLAVAVQMRNRVSAPAGKFSAGATGYQRAWHRMMLGLELRAAVRVVKG
ncbi:hypothetical protein ACQPYH_35930 [Kribbella sp. CA-245084]|uniref:hypothetical protein n=1 Tax=Kribbella sp. CA-245084 TaxID=3239940 RepID=UPI003D8F0B71